MCDDRRLRSPQRGRTPDLKDPGGWEHEDRRDASYRSRQGRRDSSRSPPRQAFHRADSRERDPRYQHDMPYDRGFDGRHDGPEDGYPRRDGSRGPRQYARGPHDYDGMYDDGTGANDRRQYERYEDDRYYSDRPHSHDRGPRRSQSPPRHHYNRSRSHSPTREAGRPSDTVILEGLPFSLSASELREIILNNSIAADFPSIDLRVSASKGNRRAFIQFESVDHAIAFVKEHFPKLHFELQHSTDDVPDGKFDTYLHYARTRDETDNRGLNTGNWTCPNCDFANYGTRVKCKICGGPQAAPNWQQNLTGMTDAANVPSQILVVYPLPPFVNEDMLANDLKRLELEKPDPSKASADGAPKLKSTAPTGNPSGYGARPDSLHRVFLMRDAETDESFKYGFAEFWTLEDAAAAMTKFRMARSFTVAACAVTVSTIHMGVFIPEDREVTPATEHLSFNPLFNPTLRVKYRDPHVYPSQRVVTSEPPLALIAKAPEEEAADAKKSKKRKAEGNVASSATKKMVPMAGQLAVWQKKHVELHTGNKPEGSDDTPATDSNRTTPRVAIGNSAKPDVKAPIKISLTESMRPNAPHPDATNATSLSSKTAVSGEVEGIVSTDDAQLQSAAQEGGAAVSYVDRERLMCLICMRKYKSVDEVNIHEKSRNHKTATENDELVKAAVPRLATRDKRLQKQGQELDNAAASSQYRDRAKERRSAYSQPKKPSAPPTRTKSGAKPPPQNDSAPAAAKPAPSKGAGMLAKMGWSAGGGLGANGDGRTEVIQTNAYQEGVGLGAEGSNLGDAAQLAERKTKNDYADYVNTVQDKARQRYNNLG